MEHGWKCSSRGDFFYLGVQCNTVNCKCIGQSSNERLVSQVLTGGTPSIKADVYSFGIIVSEVITCSRPYGLNNPISYRDIIHQVANEKNYRPSLENTIQNQDWNELAVSCWDHDLDLRISFSHVLRILRKLNNNKDVSFADSMIKKMEDLTKNLELTVAERTTQLASEKNKAELLLAELLPGSVLQKLKIGGVVPPEVFDEMTISFSDIVSRIPVSKKYLNKMCTINYHLAINSFLN